MALRFGLADKRIIKAINALEAEVEALKGAGDSGLAQAVDDLTDALELLEQRVTELENAE